MISSLIVAALAAFLTLSAVNQAAILFADHNSSRWWRRALMRFRVYCRRLYLPLWTFFSWVPEFNLRLLIRDRLSSGELTPWRAVHYITSASRLIWNPDRRREKATLQLSSVLLAAMLRDSNISDGKIFTSSGYLALSEYCRRGVPRSPISVSRQFMIVKTFFAKDSRPSEICFISPDLLLDEVEPCL